MEDKTEKIIHDRISSIEKRIDKTDKKVEDLDKKIDDVEDKVDIVDDKHDERHLEMVRTTTELVGSNKATQEATERMANSIEGLVDELKSNNKRIDSRFDLVNKEVGDIKTKIDNQESAKQIKLEEKKLNNGVIIAIISGGVILVQVLVQVIAPLLFGG